MQKMVSIVSFFVMSLWVQLASAELDRTGSEVPVERVDVVYVVLFGVLFVGMIIAYGIQIWRKERQRSRNEQNPTPAG